MELVSAGVGAFWKRKVLGVQACWMELLIVERGREVGTEVVIVRGVDLVWSAHEELLTAACSYLIVACGERLCVD